MSRSSNFAGEFVKQGASGIESWSFAIPMLKEENGDYHGYQQSSSEISKTCPKINDLVHLREDVAGFEGVATFFDITGKNHISHLRVTVWARLYNNDLLNYDPMLVRLSTNSGLDDFIRNRRWRVGAEAPHQQCSELLEHGSFQSPAAAVEYAQREGSTTYDSVLGQSDLTLEQIKAHDQIVNLWLRPQSPFMFCKLIARILGGQLELT